MAELGVFDEPKDKWIQYDEDTEVQIRHIGKEELRKINLKAAKTAKLTGVDSVAINNKMVGRAAVLGWRKIDDHSHPGLKMKGQPLPFTQENIDMLMRRSLEFSNFVNENCLDSKLFLDEIEEKEETKNA